MDRRIVGFHQDAESHWVAELECGHDRHVRHDPPWAERPWVVTPHGRAGRLGTVLACRKCDEGRPRDRGPSSPPSVVTQAAASHRKGSTALVFDLDGTISDPSVGIARSLDYALTACGYPPLGEGDVARLIGPPLDEAFRSIVGNVAEERIVALVAKYRERYAELGFSENVVYPGIAQALRELDAAGIVLGVCTSKRVDFAERILDRFDLRAHFRFVSGGDVGVTKEAQLAALVGERRIDASATMIGDRAVDIVAAKSNGLASIGVLWGFGSATELQDAAPDRLLAAPHELTDAVLARFP